MKKIVLTQLHFNEYNGSALSSSAINDVLLEKEREATFSFCTTHTCMDVGMSLYFLLPTFNIGATVCPPLDSKPG